MGWEAFNLYFNGRHLAVNNTTEGLRWRHQDHLGSLRVKTDSTGAVKCRYWYYPYGELWTSTCSEADVRRFTDKERDPESGLDYFGARYYASGHGRFTSVDPALESGQPGDPQTWNRYAYVGNRPTLMVDPDGRTGVKCDACGYSSANEAMAALPERLAAETEEQKSLRSLLVGPAIGVATLVTPGPDELVLGAVLSRLAGAAKLLRGVKRSGALDKVSKSTGIVAKDGTEITGLTKHGVNRVVGDGAKRAGTKPDAILDAVKDPTKIKEGIDSQGRPFKVYTGENARVVVNPESGKIISANPLSREGANLP